MLVTLNDVLLDARAAVAIAGVTSQAPGDLLARNAIFFHAASGFLGTAGEFVAQNRRIAVPAWTALQNQNLFHHAFSFRSVN